VTNGRAEMKKLVVATRNAGKKREFQQMLGQLGYEVLSLADYPDIPDIEETGETFEENAEIKARTASEFLGLPVIADDSGLSVDRLGGAPGVYSARYAGHDASDEANIRKLLAELKKLGDPDGQAREVTLASGRVVKLLSDAAFICTIVYIDPHAASGSGRIVAEGRVEGYVIDQPAGEGGFGYDPVFYVPQYGRTMAELSGDEKNAVSHRGKALKQLMEQLRGRL